MPTAVPIGPGDTVRPTHALGALNVQLDANGQSSDIDHALLANTTFQARADSFPFTSFSFPADGGAVFSTVPVPEPATWALMLSADLGLGVAMRRRRRGAA